MYAAVAFILLRRRHLWLRLLDANELFWQRLGFSKRIANFGRGLSESRSFAIATACLAVAFLLLAIASALAYLYFSHRVT